MPSVFDHGLEQPVYLEYSKSETKIFLMSFGLIMIKGTNMAVL